MPFDADAVMEIGQRFVIIKLMALIHYAIKEVKNPAVCNEKIAQMLLHALMFAQLCRAFRFDELPYQLVKAVRRRQVNDVA